jgi:hypothetical protein
LLRHLYNQTGIRGSHKDNGDDETIGDTMSYILAMPISGDEPVKSNLD